MATASVLRALVTVDGAEASAAKIGAFGAKIESAATLGGRSLTRLQSAGALAFVGIGVAAAVGLGKAVGATVKFGDEVLILHRQLGISAEDASRLQVVFEHFGVTTQQASVGLGIFEKNLVNGSKFVKLYGLSLTDATGAQKPFLQVLGEAADKFLALPPGAERAAFAMNLFGRSGKTLIPILQLGSKGLSDIAAAADKYGLVLSGSNLEAIHKYALAQNDLGLASTGLKLSIGEQLIPALTALDHILTTGIALFGKIPGPIKAGALAVIALGGAMVGLGIAVGIVRAALANLGIGLGRVAVEEAAATVATEANTVALDANAVAAGADTVAHGGLIGALGGVGAAAVPLGGVIAGLVIHHYANAAAAKADAEGHGLLGAALRAVGNIASPVSQLFAKEPPILDANATSWGALGAAALAASGVIATSAAQTADAVVRFMGMTDAAFKAWRVSTRDAMNGVKGSLGELAGKAHLTARQVIKSFTDQISIQKSYRNNWETLIARGLPQDMEKQIQEMGLKGASLVKALANANDAQFGRIIRQWQRSKGIAVQVTGAIGAMHQAALDAAGTYALNFDVNIHGQIPAGGKKVYRAAGGMVYAAGGGNYGIMELTRPTYITNNVVAGEGGREFVLPANNRGHEWVAEAAREGAERANGGGRMIHVTVVMPDGRVLAEVVTAGQNQASALRGVRS